MLTAKQKLAISVFIREKKQSPDLNKFITILDDPLCCIFVQQHERKVDVIDTLAVAFSDTGSLFPTDEYYYVLTPDCQERLFHYEKTYLGTDILPKPLVQIVAFSPAPNVVPLELSGDQRKWIAKFQLEHKHCDITTIIDSPMCGVFKQTVPITGLAVAFCEESETFVLLDFDGIRWPFTAKDLSEENTKFLPPETKLSPRQRWAIQSFLMQQKHDPEIEEIDIITKNPICGVMLKSERGVENQPALAVAFKKKGCLLLDLDGRKHFFPLERLT